MPHALNTMLNVLRTVPTFLVAIGGDWWPYAISYVFTLVPSHFMIQFFVKQLYSLANGQNRSDFPPMGPRISATVGILERVLYVASIHLQKPEFIGVWLALKVAAGIWKWNKGANGKMPPPNRLNFNIFLVGCALSVLYALVGAEMALWITQGKYLLAIFVPIVLVVGSLVAAAWLSSVAKKNG